MGRISTSAARIVAIVAFVVCTSQQTGKCLAQTRESYGVGITISGPAAEREQIKAHLDSLGKLPTGKKLLEAIEAAALASGHTITVDYVPGGASVYPAKDASFEEAMPRRYDMEGDLVRIVEPGPGTSSVVRYDPRFKETNKDAQASDGGSACVTPEVVLGHELVHALHALQGRILARIPYDEPNGNATNYEERVTTGLGGVVDGDGLSENAIRRDQGVGGRATYARLCEMAKLPRHPFLGSRGILKSLESAGAGPSSPALPATGSTSVTIGSPERRTTAQERADLLARTLNSSLGE